MKILNIEIDELINISRTKKMVCFGGGESFVRFCERFADKKIENYIGQILDNNEQKNNTCVRVKDRDIKVNTVDEFLKNNSDDFIVVICCAGIESILNQLKGIAEFQNIDIAIANFVIYEADEADEKKRIYPESFRITEKPVIPKVIHYCWFGGKPIPERYKEWMSSWKKYCPDYEIVEWNESNYDIKKNEFMYEAYKAKKWGFVSDYARLDIIYNHGGIYLDTDVELIRNLDELLYQEAYMGIEYTHLIAPGLGIGAVAKNKMIKDLMSYYDDKHFDVSNMIPSPSALDGVFRKAGYEKNGEYQVVNGMTIFPQKVLAAQSNVTGMEAPNSHSFSIHHYDGSWTDERIKRINWYRHELYKELVKKNIIEVRGMV